MQKPSSGFETENGAAGQPIFIDIIIKVMLHRVFANVEDRKLLTAEKILGNAEFLINEVIRGRNLRIVTTPSLRQNAKSLHIDILMKKYLLMKGILYNQLNRDLEAQDCYLECMAYGSEFDPRLRMECISRLMAMQKKHNRMDLY